MQSSDTPGKISVPFADQGTRRNVPVNYDGSADGQASYTNGFPDITFQPIAAGGYPPWGRDFNGILYAVTNMLRWQNSGGGFAFDASLASEIDGYPRGALLLKGDRSGFWLCTQNNNSNNPDSGGAGWVDPFTSSNIALSESLTLFPGAEDVQSVLAMLGTASIRGVSGPGALVGDGRTISSGDGLNGGGNLSQNRTLSVDGSVVRTSRRINAGSGLAGGGDLSSDKTIGIPEFGVRAFHIAPHTIISNRIAEGGVSAFNLQNGTEEDYWVGVRTSNLGVGRIGSYAMLEFLGSGGVNPGTMIAGSNLRYSDTGGGDASSSPSGTWRCMGLVAGSNRVTSWLRVS